MGSDPAVYLYVGKAWVAGELPYLNAFDNKGPFFYLMNALSYALHPSWGVWAVGMLLITVSSLLAYRLARAALPAVPALGALAATLLVYLAVYQGGNYTEDYTLPLVLALLLTAANRWIEGNQSRRLLFVAGVCGGLVLLIRHNMVVPWIVFTAALVREPRQSRSARLRNVGALVAGGCAAAAPFVAYLAATGTFDEFWYAYITFNLQYVGAGTTLARLSFFPWVAAHMTPVVPLGLAVAVRMFQVGNRTDHRLYYLFVIGSFVGVLAVLSALGTTYGQYLTALVPFVLVGVLATLQIASERWGARVAPVAASMLLAACAVWAGPHVQSQRDLLGDRGESRRNLVAVVAEQVKPQERILVLGIHTFVYLETDTHASTRLFYQHPLAVVDTSLRSELMEHLRTSAPRVVVDAGYRPGDTEWVRLSGAIGDMLEQRGYRRIDQEDDGRLSSTAIVWVRR